MSCRLKPRVCAHCQVKLFVLGIEVANMHLFMGEEEEVKDLFNKLTDLMALGQEEEDVLTTAAAAAIPSLILLGQNCKQNKGSSQQLECTEKGFSLICSSGVGLSFFFERTQKSFYFSHF